MKYRFFSWNVNGIRSVLKKGALKSLIDTYSPDFLCIQETKAKEGQAEVDYPEYEELWNSAVRPGYSGTAIFTKKSPLHVQKDFPEELKIKYLWDEDVYGSPLSEGRILTAEFPEFFLVTVYTPNSKRDLSRLGLRKDLWDPAFMAYLKELDSKKPVIICGDFNAARTEIDLARPKENEKNAGYTIEEREGINNLIRAGFIDTFREKNPDARRYTWWAHWGHARENNIGWRIDYFLISSRLKDHLVSAEIYESHLGSDHCPISIELEF